MGVWDIYEGDKKRLRYQCSDYQSSGVIKGKLLAVSYDDLALPCFAYPTVRMSQVCVITPKNSV